MFDEGGVVDVLLAVGQKQTVGIGLSPLAAKRNAQIVTYETTMERERMSVHPCAALRIDVGMRYVRGLIMLVLR